MNYHNILKEDILNGEGVRVVLFVSGCEHHCKNCQNPQTWDTNSGIPFTKESYKEIKDALLNDVVSGITFSGGDPLHPNNVEDIASVIHSLHTALKREMNEQGRVIKRDVWIYTGYDFEIAKQIMKEVNILDKVDVLVDGKYDEELRDVNLKWRGSSNQRVIDVQRSLEQNKVILYCD